MSGGNRTTSTQETKSEPWGPAQPVLQNALSEAQRLYGEGVGGQFYDRPAWVPMDQQTRWGLDDYKWAANRAGDKYETGLDTVMGIMQNPFNEQQRAAMDRFSQTMTGTDPAFQDALRQAQEGATNAVNMSATGMGRYGSGVHQGSLVRNVGDLTNRIMAGDLARRDAAARSLFSAGQQGMANRFGAMNQMPGMVEGTMLPGRASIEVGRAFEDERAREIDDEMRRFYAGQTTPWDQIARLNAAAAGAGGYGTTTGTTMQPRNRFGSAAGGALAGASLFGPIGAIGGGLLGAFM